MNKVGTCRSRVPCPERLRDSDADRRHGGRRRAGAAVGGPVGAVVGGAVGAVATAPGTVLGGPSHYRCFWRDRYGYPPSPLVLSGDRRQGFSGVWSPSRRAGRDAGKWGRIRGAQTRSSAARSEAANVRQSERGEAP